MPTHSPMQRREYPQWIRNIITSLITNWKDRRSRRPLPLLQVLQISHPGDAEPPVAERGEDCLGLLLDLIHVVPGQIVKIYRVTIQVVPNLPLTPKQFLRFSTCASY